MLGTVAGVLMQVPRRGLFNVIPGSIREVWKDWEVRGLILFSLLLQIILVFFGHRRKYMGGTRVRVTIWSAYFLADWCATFALGVISQNNLNDECPKGHDEKLKDQLMAFWAPFLLLHLGGPDTITAYALEDNQLWLRHLGGLVIHASLVGYVFLVALPGPSWFPFSSALIFLAGLIKYGERTRALRSANFERLRNSMLTEPDPGPSYAKFMEEFTLKKAEGYYVEAKYMEEFTPKKDEGLCLEVEESTVPSNSPVREKLISEAYDQFGTFKRLFVDLILTFQDRDNSQSYFKRLSSEQAFQVIDIELGFAFDTFFTKAPVIYNVGGFIFRVVTSFFTLVSLVVFGIRCETKYQTIDLVITYLLMGVALLLEIYAAIILLNSDWMAHWLSKRTLKNSSIMWLQKPDRPRWSNSMSQCNLFEFSLDKKHAYCAGFEQFLQIDGFQENLRKRTYEKVTGELKKLIFSRLKEYIATNEPDPPALWTRRGSFALKGNECSSQLEWTTKVEFDQSILIWHIATELCYNSAKDQNLHDASENRMDQSLQDAIKNRRGSKRISDYMLYLLIMCPFMLPVGIGMIRFRDTRAEAREFFEEKNLSEKVKACEKLLQVNTEVLPVKVKGDRSKSVLFDACRLAEYLLREPDQARRWKITVDMWVEMLAYAATHCRSNHHAQQLRKGGELLTHVWLLMAHLGIFGFQIHQGHARAKLVAK